MCKGENMKKGLVMEGGAMRGMFTCGVIDTFMENGIEFDGAIGVSAGAAFGCNIKSKQIGRAVRYNKNYCNDSRYASIQSWIRTGDLYNQEFCYGEMIYVLDPWDDETFKENPMKFYVVATDVERGKPVYHLCSDGLKRDVDWIRASASIPVFSTPVRVDGYKLLDGGTTDPIPVKFMENKGYDRIVVVETQPDGFVKPQQKYLSVIKRALKAYPKVITALENRHNLYNEQKQYIKEKQESGELFVLRPEQPLNIGSVEKDPNELERVYQEGRKVALKHLKEVQEYLSK